MNPDRRIDALSALAIGRAGLQMLVLFGSRARGDARAGSDWDLAYEAKDSFDPEGLAADAAAALSADRIDLVDLDRAGGQLRYRVARDGIVLFADDPRRFERFWLNAVTFWCDARPVIERGYDALLGELRR